MCRKTILLTGIIVLTLLATLSAEARSVFRHHVFLSQPDGSVTEAWITGDEFSHTVQDAGGRFLRQDAEGWWRVSAPQIHVASSRKVLISRRNAVRPALRPSGGVMRKHAVILLVEFQDKKMKAGREDFVRMLTKTGYSEGGAVGSALDYFRDQLGGDYEFDFQVGDVVTLEGKCADYFSNNSDGSDSHPDAAVAEACRKSAESVSNPVDFSVADDDGDGEVDNVFLFVAGMDEADGGGDDCPWSHMAYLEFTPSAGLSLGGKTINNYAISTELRVLGNGSTAFAGIGTFCHEYSHSLGLPDLYDTDYSGSGGYGNALWRTTNLMDSGNGNADFSIPPHYSAVEYDFLGIGNPEDLKIGSYSLEPISEGRRYLRMPTDKEGEYYLIENRGAGKWDSAIGGKGLLIYHIDKSDNPAGRSDQYGRILSAFERWELNEVNCRPSRQCAELVAATAGLTAYESSGEFKNNEKFAFWPQPEAMDFTPLTDPPFVFSDGTGSPLAITDIVMDGDVARFKVVNYLGVEIPDVVLGKTEVFQDAAIIQWSSDDPGYEDNSFVSWGRSDSRMETVEVEPYASGKYAIVLDGLSAMTAYRVMLYFEKDGVKSTESPVNFTTKRMYDGYPFIFLNSVARNSDGTFPKGTGFPLRVYNLGSGASVSWTFNGAEVSAGKDGYFHPSSSGTLRAEISYKNGGSDMILKEILIK